MSFLLQQQNIRCAWIKIKKQQIPFSWTSGIFTNCRLSTCSIWHFYVQFSFKCNYSTKILIKNLINHSRVSVVCSWKVAKWLNNKKAYLSFLLMAFLVFTCLYLLCFVLLGKYCRVRWVELGTPKMRREKPESPLAAMLFLCGKKIQAKYGSCTSNDLLSKSTINGGSFHQWFPTLMVDFQETTILIKLSQMLFIVKSGFSKIYG